MITNFTLKNCGPITEAQGTHLSPINLIIGDNSCGKTFLLKMLYVIVRAQEEYGRGNDNRDFSEVLSEKLYWTFQPEKLGDIVQNGKDKKLSVNVELDDKSALVFEFGHGTTKKVTPIHNNLPKRDDNSIFLPPKEVLSLSKVVLRNSIQDRAFGYDATYADLVLALQRPTQRGRNFNAFSHSRGKLEDMFSGRIEYESSTDSWVYKKGNSRFSIHSTAEGIKKIAILDTLLGNRFLSPKSIIFIDEPESALHPTAIVKLMDIIQILAHEGMQFFIASHSYFVIKKLGLLAQNTESDICCLHADTDGSWNQSYLYRDGLPDTDIINESIRLFEQEFQGID